MIIIFFSWIFVLVWTIFRQRSISYFGTLKLIYLFIYLFIENYRNKASTEKILLSSGKSLWQQIQWWMFSMKTLKGNYQKILIQDEQKYKEYRFQ